MKDPFELPKTAKNNKNITNTNKIKPNPTIKLKRAPLLSPYFLPSSPPPSPGETKEGPGEEEKEEKEESEGDGEGEGESEEGGEGEEEEEGEGGGRLETEKRG